MSIKRINEFPEGSGSLTNDDIFLFMDDPSGSSITKKISLSEISDAIGIVATSGSVSNILGSGNITVVDSAGTFTISSSGLIKSDPVGISGATAILNIVQISQANFDNIVTPDPNTLYVIND